MAVSSQANAGNPTQSNTDLALNSSNYSYQNNSSQSLDKTLATIGQGSLSVGGEAVNPEGLNRDISNLTKDIYDVDRQQGNIELTVDHRLLSEDGRKQIAEDVKRTEILGDSLIDLAKVSVSVTGSDEGETSLRDHIGNKQDYFTATKNFTQNPDNAEHIATLGNNHATPEQVQAAYTALANSIAQQMGVSPTEALVLMQNDPQFAGVHSRDTNLLYINDLVHNSAGEAVNTVGHETQHYLDNQQNPNASQSTEYKANRENYAEIMGNATEDYLKFNFAQNDYSLADNKSHSMGKTADDVLRNLNILSENQQQFKNENPDSLDPNILVRAIPALEQGAGLAVLGAVALSGDDDAKKQFAQDVEKLFQDVDALLGRNAYGSERIDAEYIVNELIALKIKEDLLNESVSPNYRDYNAIYEKRASLTEQLPPEIRVGIESIANQFVGDFNSGNLGSNTSSGGFSLTDVPTLVITPNPIQNVSGPVALENIPPEVPGKIGDFEPAESLPNITGTPIPVEDPRSHIYLSESGDTWRNPVTNEIEPLPEGTKIHKDHIFPKNEIKQLPGFDLLTPEQQKQILNDPENFQLMPASLNCSKGCTVEGTDKPWNPSERVVPGGLNPDYRNWLEVQQNNNRAKLEEKIEKLLDKGN